MCNSFNQRIFCVEFLFGLRQRDDRGVYRFMVYEQFLFQFWSSLNWIGMAISFDSDILYFGFPDRFRCVLFVAGTETGFDRFRFGSVQADIG